MIVAGWLMLPDPQQGVCLKRGFMTVEHGVIRSVELGEEIFMADMGGEGTIVCPGFVDAHLHLPQVPVIGADGMGLLQWLDRVVFPAEAAWADADLAADATDGAVRTLCSFGTTAFAAYATVHFEATRAAMRAAAEVGVRALIGQVLMDRNAPEELVRPAAQLLHEAALHDQIGRVRPAVSPRFAVSCTPELLAGAGKVADATGQFVQTHLSETREECAKVRELFEGLSYTEVYRRAGLLRRRCVLGHGIWLDDEERGAIGASGAAIAHCPTANAFLGAGMMDLRRNVEAKIRPAPGSDIGAGPDRSMVRVARAMLDTARLRGDLAPPASHAWWSITGGNASVLGFDDAGQIERGRSADLLLIEPDIDLELGEDEPSIDPLAALLYAWDDRWLKRTLVHGKTVYTGL